MSHRELVGKLGSVASKAIDQLNTAVDVGESDELRDPSIAKNSLAIIREYSRMYSAETARAGVAVKLASTLGLKKADLLPVWRQLSGQPEAANQ